MLIWEALYRGGSCLPQYNEGGKENKYTDIDRSKLEKFILKDAETGDPKLILNIKEGQKLIYRRRIAQNFKNQITERVHIMGWQQTIGGKAVQSINFLFESTGHIEMTDGFKENHQWFYPVRFLPEEEI